MKDDIEIIINKLLKKCDLGGIIEKTTRVSGGLLNRMYKVKTEKGTYAIKLLNPEVMKRENAKSNHIFAETISNIAKDNGVSCLPAKIIDNTLIQQIDDYYFLVYVFLKNEHLLFMFVNEFLYYKIINILYNCYIILDY